MSRQTAHRDLSRYTVEQRKQQVLTNCRVVDVVVGRDHAEIQRRYIHFVFDRQTLENQKTKAIRNKAG